MDNTIATLDQALGTAAKLHRVLREEGLPEAALHMPIDDPGMRERLVRFWRAGAYDASTGQKLARAIMGSTAVFPEDVAQHLGVTFSAKQLTQLESIPFTEAELQEVKDTHVLVAGFPLSILDIRKKVPHLFYTSKGGWYQSEAFARKKVRLGWHLVRRDVVPGSTNHTFQEQTALLGENEVVPRACEMVYAAILGAMATGKKLPENVYGRCDVLDSHGGRVDVGFDSGRLSVDDYWDGNHLSGIGLAAARKS